MKNSYLPFLILAYGLIIIYLGLTLSWIDDIRKDAKPPSTPKIHVEPETLSLRLNGSGMIVKVIRAIFEDAPNSVNTVMEGPGMENVIKLSKESTTDKDYSLYLSATNSGDVRDSTLEGFMRLTYNFSDGIEYEKKIPVQVFISNKTQSK